MNPLHALKLLALMFVGVFLFALLASQTESVRSQSASNPAVVRLGKRLFKDERFSTPNGDLPASCSHCHLLDEDPQGLRAYADFLNRSWVSSRSQDRRRLELRNSPTIFDVREMPRLHFDGEFSSLEDLVRGTFSGRPMGWLPGEEQQAFERLRTVLLTDKGEGPLAEGSYREQFKNAWNVDLEKLDRDRSVDLVAKAVAEFMRTLNSRRDAPYDRFIALNGLPAIPATGETGREFADRLLKKIDEVERANAIQFPAGFNASSLKGLKLFFSPAGNCASCHQPPLFSDHSFHNIGISQNEYDRIHGEGAFTALEIPDAATARRPSTRYRETPSSPKPGEADLGFWNFVDLRTSTLRKKDESDDRFLRRMIATFKTPTLRNLSYTYPYFHDGSVHTVPDVVEEMIRLSELARVGKLREPDEELLKIRLQPTDIDPIVAFLRTLNEKLKKGD
jgi:cytochrome c peroxidase